jgi:ABC-2 type transport system ATP-binding protein
VNGYEDVEPILAALRTGACVIEDLQLEQADLEDVFLQIMSGQHSEINAELKGEAA